jgi:DNA-nicking Smr family endonuclease
MANDFMSEEDKALFREHMRAVKPLNEKTKRAESPAPVTPMPLKRKQPPVDIIKQNYFLSDYINDTVLSQSILSYSIPGFPGKRFRELKNGHIPWEAKLDLHGLKTDEARQSLCQFIQDQVQNNKRCILIIHGKGGHQGDAPVIKNLVNRWLPQFSEVVAFHSAQAKDGGYGAVYVFLKRNK